MTGPLMSRDEVAALLGIAPNSVRNTLRRYGITEQRGYDRAAVENLERPGQGARTDLRKDTMLTITDTAGTSGSVTVESYDVAKVLRGWYTDAPDEVYDAIADLQEALDRNEDVGDLCDYLAIMIERV